MEALVLTMTDRRQMSLERVLAEAAPTIVAMSALSIAGLLWSLQMSISDIKAQQTRLLDIVKDSQVRVTALEARVRDIELKVVGAK
jgi:hypothetical protein